MQAVRRSPKVEEVDPFKDVPSGSVKDIEEWVGEDSEKAQLALDAEAERDKPRTSLFARLEGLLAGPDPYPVESESESESEEVAHDDSSDASSIY